MTTAKRVKDAKIEKKFELARDKKKSGQVLHAPAQPLQAVRTSARLLRKFGMCRLCFRGLALRGEIPGVSKSSW
jgi:small subunit ribosomal protein S14